SAGRVARSAHAVAASESWTEASVSTAPFCPGVSPSQRPCSVPRARPIPPLSSCEELPTRPGGGCLSTDPPGQERHVSGGGLAYMGHTPSTSSSAQNTSRTAAGALRDGCVA